jgi:pilus assembly protein CpaE
MAHARLEAVLGPDVPVQSTWPEGEEDAIRFVKRVSVGSPDVVVLGADLEPAAALDLAAAFNDEHPEVEVLLFATPTPRMWERALRGGIRDIIAPEGPDEEVRGRLERSLNMAQRRRANLAGEHSDEPTGQVIVVLSPKGGAGKTTVASNLAVGIGKASSSVVLFDTDLQFGDIASALRLTPDVDFSDAVNAGLTDATALKLALTPHHTGVYALCASDTPADADDITGEDVARAITLLRDEFAFVVVDTDAGLGERTLAAIDSATDLVFLCATDVPSVRSLRKELEALDTLGMGRQQRHFVLNRADAKVGLTPADIQETINHKIDVFIPSSRSVPMALNQGIPLLESGAASPVTRALQDLVGRFVGLPTPAAPAVRPGRRRRKEM